MVGVLLVALLAGCGKKAAVPEVTVPEEKEKPAVENNSPPILEFVRPQRDPFATAAGQAQAVGQSSVAAEGRDPFAAATGQAGVGKKGTVAAKGRDPFSVVANATEPPVLPEEPVKPDPGEPTGGVTDGRVNVSVSTLDRCWLDVFVDGGRVLRTNVPVGKELSWEGKDVTLEQVGREYAVRLMVNGKNLGLLGDLAKKLEAAPYTDRELGVRITLEKRYTGGVLVGLKVSALIPE